MEKLVAMNDREVMWVGKASVYRSLAAGGAWVVVRRGKGGGILHSAPEVAHYLRRISLSR